ncbi:rhamnogalacturonan acetylesterase [Solimonas marina]|nr:rhamnogalacturonan acetylesterase [Solimonas marina]
MMLRAWLATILLLGATTARAQTAVQWKFDFGDGPAAPGYTAVGAATFYDASRGYGFEPGATAHLEHRGGSALDGDFVTAARPFLFSASVPEGNYRVTVTLGDPQGTSETTVKAESRRLMLEAVTTSRGARVTRSFIVNVRRRALTPPPANAPGGSAVRTNDREVGSYTWDDKLTLEFSGPAPKLAALTIEPVEVPTVYLAGDSTVTDHRWEPTASWGQMLPRFFAPQVAIANHAESGETLKSFLSELRLAKILETLHAGDYLFIQFAHNDQKKQWPQTYVDAATTYRAYLRVYIEEAKRRGAIPVLVTSPQRRNFDARGHIVNTLEGYPDAARAVAREEGIALIDLTAMSTTLYEALGPERAPLAFAEHGADHTHNDNYGAYELARCIVEGIRRAKLPLAQFIADDAGHFDPAQPDDPGAFDVPASLAHSDIKPRGN